MSLINKLTWLNSLTNNYLIYSQYFSFQSDDPESDSDQEATSSKGDDAAKVPAVLTDKYKRLPRVYIAAAEALAARMDKKNQLKAYFYGQSWCRDMGRLRKLVQQVGIDCVREYRADGNL